jgi:hypothetical protein
MPVLPDKASPTAKEKVQNAIDWAVGQKDRNGEYITIKTCHSLVHKVRDKFNADGTEYGTFDYYDLIQ